MSDGIRPKPPASNGLEPHQLAGEVEPEHLRLAARRKRLRLEDAGLRHEQRSDGLSLRVDTRTGGNRSSWKHVIGKALQLLGIDDRRLANRLEHAVGAGALFKEALEETRGHPNPVF